MNEKLDLILTEIRSMKADQSSMKSEQTAMKAEMQLMKAQLEENTQLTKAIYHRQTEFEAKFQDEMTATKAQIDEISTEQKAISGVLGEHEIAIRSIRNPIYKKK